MSPDLQHALVYLLGAVALAVPATVRAVPAALERLTKARADTAQAALVAEQSRAAELADLRRRIEDVEHERDQCHLLVEGLRREVAELRRAITSGGIYRRNGE